MRRATQGSVCVRGRLVANEKMAVIAVVGQKGGAGKSTLTRAVASAALTAKWSVHIIDADPQTGLVDWHRDVAAKGGGPLSGDRLTIEAQTSVQVIAEHIEELYEAGETSLVLIDTKGELTQWTADIMQEADRLILPVMATPSDIRAQQKTLRFYEAMRQQAPEAFPPLAAVITRVPSRASKAVEASISVIEATFPVIPTIIMERAAYTTMDAEGFLHTLLHQRSHSPDPLVRGQARPFAEALSEAVDMFNDVMEIEHEA